jgi:hypothetical protein
LVILPAYVKARLLILDKVQKICRHRNITLRNYGARDYIGHLAV